jgi:hypothetical protein
MRRMFLDMLTYVLAVLVVGLLCLDDIEVKSNDQVVGLSYCDEMDEGPCACSEDETRPFEILNWAKDVITIQISDWVLEAPTDGNLQWMGRCMVRQLQFEERAGRYGTKLLIANKGWYPSKYRVVDLAWAEILADYDKIDANYEPDYDLEEEAMMAYGPGVDWDD